MYTEGTTKGNVFQKLWAFIVKIWKLICKAFGNFIKWVKSIFSRNVTPIDDITDECFGSTGSAPSRISSPPVSAKSPSAPTASKAVSNNTQNSVSIQIPKSDKSEMPVEDVIDLMYKPIRVKYDKDKRGIYVSGNDLKAANNSTPVQDVSVGGQQGIAYVIDLCKSVHVQEKMQAVIFSLSKQNWGQFSSALDALADVFNNTNTSMQSLIGLDSLEKCQGVINNVMEQLSNIADPSANIPNDSKLLGKLNDFANLCSYMQMGLNALIRSCSMTYKIDAKYIGRISDINMMDKFVDRMISGGIPAKYIAYNVYAACNDSLNGRGDAHNPIWGQSRLVLFPKTDQSKVYKIALSGWGKQANASEQHISKAFSVDGGNNLIAMTLDMTRSKTVLTAERADNDTKVDNTLINALSREMMNFIQRHNIPIDIEDLHSKNVGVKDGKVVAMDYAWSVRRVV